MYGKLNSTSELTCYFVVNISTCILATRSAYRSNITKEISVFSTYHPNFYLRYWIEIYRKLLLELGKCLTSYRRTSGTSRIEELMGR